jgi:hypothetical protein
MPSARLRILIILCLVSALALVLVVRMNRVEQPVEPPPLTNRVYIGLWQPGAPEDMRRIERFERSIRKRVAIVQFYFEWDQDPDPKLIDNVISRGSVPLITWEPPGGCDEINSGKFDADIQKWARALAVYRDRSQILLRTMHEMNISGYPWSIADEHCTDGTYIEAWRRVRRMFDSAGATNVQHVWCPNVFWDQNTTFDGMFPGDEYVDWIGLDGYNWGRGNWQSFKEVFGASYERITRLSSKPLIIAEVGSAEAGDGGRRKAKWIADALNNDIPSMPRIRAVVWFNENWQGHAFPVTSSRQAERAFATAIGSPVYVSHWP